MWTGQEVTLLDSVSISILGLCVVFSALVSLAIAIILISKILGLLIKPEGVKAAATAAAAVQQPGIDEEAYAVLLAVINEEARQSGETVRVTSIKEL